MTQRYFLSDERRAEIVAACERAGCTDACLVSEVLILAEEAEVTRQALELFVAGRVVPSLSGGEVRWLMSPSARAELNDKINAVLPASTQQPDGVS